MTTQKRPQNCGTSYCSCIECVMEPDYKALWEQMCERCDELDKKLAQPEQEPTTLFETFDQYGEGWERLAWELCAEEHGEDACSELIWEGGPIPEPWGDRWLKYEDEAKRLIALVRKYTTPPQRTWVGLTEQEQGAIMEDLNAHGTNLYPFSQAIEAKLKEKNT